MVFSDICKANGEPSHSGCRTRGHSRLGGFCAHCFVILFKDDPRKLTVRHRSKELQVVAHIASTYDGFVHDRLSNLDLEGGCCATRRRIDLRKLINNTLLCIEIDEGDHKSYIHSDEEHRYDDWFMDLSGKLHLNQV